MSPSQKTRCLLDVQNTFSCILHRPPWYISTLFKQRHDSSSFNEYCLTYACIAVYIVSFHFGLSVTSLRCTRYGCHIHFRAQNKNGATVCVSVKLIDNRPTVYLSRYWLSNSHSNESRVSNVWPLWPVFIHLQSGSDLTKDVCACWNLPDKVLSDLSALGLMIHLLCLIILS